jgi:hypothetical protein
MAQKLRKSRKADSFLARMNSFGLKSALRTNDRAEYRRQWFFGPVKARVALLGASCSTTDAFLNSVVLKGIGSTW